MTDSATTFTVRFFGSRAGMKAARKTRRSSRVGPTVFETDFADRGEAEAFATEAARKTPEKLLGSMHGRVFLNERRPGAFVCPTTLFEKGAEPRPYG